MYHESWCLRLKPIFHCDAKLLALGTFAPPNAKDSTFASPDAKIPTCWYLLRKVTQIFAFYPTRNLKFAFYLTRNPNASQWKVAKFWRWPCTFNVFCVDFICMWYPTRTQFPVEPEVYNFAIRCAISFLEYAPGFCMYLFLYKNNFPLTRNEPPKIEVACIEKILFVGHSRINSIFVRYVYINFFTVPRCNRSWGDKTKRS